MNSLISIQGNIVDLTKIYKISTISTNKFEVWFTIYMYGPNSNSLSVGSDIDFSSNLEKMDEDIKALKVRVESLRQKVIDRWNQYRNQYKNDIEHLELESSDE